MPKKPYDRPMTLEEMAEVKDEDIDFSDIPELGEDFWKNAVLVHPEGTQQVTCGSRSRCLTRSRRQGRAIRLA